MTFPPFAPATFPEVPAIDGVRLATAEAGIKYRGRTDVLAVVFDRETEVAGVLTKSKCASAPVDWCRERIDVGKARALLVNSGNANAFTGKRGAESVRISAEQMADAAGCSPDEVLLASTGVIGEPLDASVFADVLNETVARAESGHFLDAPRRS